jgi:exodeoxyribonuclease VII small subunit
MVPDEESVESASTTPISQLGYEDCRDELIEVVRLLEQGGLDLDASLKLWERGEQLAKRCEEQLAGARQRITDALGGGQGEER